MPKPRGDGGARGGARGAGGGREEGGGGSEGGGGGDPSVNESKRSEASGDGGGGARVKVNDGNAEITAAGLAAGLGKQLRQLWQYNKLWLCFLALSVAFLLIVEVSLSVVLGYVVCHVVAGFFKWLLQPIINVSRGGRDTVHRSEQTFYDPKTQKDIRFPSLNEPATLDLSLVVPAWNEERRLRPMLDATLAYFQKRLVLEPHLTFEIIVVDDGSTDRTCQVVEEYIRRLDEGSDRLRLLKSARNRGKGGAVREGMLRARGERLLMVDADGATEIADLDKLESKLRKDAKHGDPALVVGSRYWLELEANVTRTPFRKFLMVGGIRGWVPGLVSGWVGGNTALCFDAVNMNNDDHADIFSLSLSSRRYVPHLHTTCLCLPPRSTGSAS
jgi:hypothetical protein